MALTSAQKISIRTYLGYPMYATWDTTLESMLEIASADAEMSAHVTSVLAALATIESEITDLHGLAVAAKAEESTLNPNRYRDLRAAGRREVGRLAAAMNLDGPKRDVFGAGAMGVALPMG